MDNKNPSRYDYLRMEEIIYEIKTIAGDLLFCACHELPEGEHDNIKHMRQEVIKIRQATEALDRELDWGR